jgi:predicted acyltransferase
VKTAAKPAAKSAKPAAALPVRITSIDALRGFVMFMMIYVNDLAGAGKIVPDWMVHFSDRHRGGSGMTFVDLVFPAFLFIVGMSIPFALGSRLSKGEPLWKILRHILGRTLSLIFIGILMVNEAPNSEKLGWSAALWSTLIYLSAIFAFSTIAPPRQLEPGAKRTRAFGLLSALLRAAGFAALVWLAFAWRGENGQRIITLSPFSIHTDWYGILGLLGWAYLVGAMVFLIFRGQRTALLGCMVLLLCLYPADKNHAFENFWLARYVGVGETLGALAAITVGGVLLASTLVAADTVTARLRLRFTCWFIAGTAAGAWLLHGLYGISKNNATPSWCLWACAITAALWLGFYLVSDVWAVGFLAKPLAVAGQNVLLAYLLSEMLPSTLVLLNLGDWYRSLAAPELWQAVVRAGSCSVVILCATAGLNRLGFRLKL